MEDRWEKTKKLREDLNKDWSTLWKTKYHDKRVAEEISRKEFPNLFVKRGEIIHATRDYKPLSFSEILSRHIGSDMASKINPDPEIGGWGKFIKRNFRKNTQSKKRVKPQIKLDLSQHQRKNGAGWKNKSRIWNKQKNNSYD